MAFGVNNNLAGPAINSLSTYQTGLQTAFSQLSSGNRLVSASIDPAGLAIYNALEAQSNGFDQGSANVSDALNALSVAQGALSNTQDALQQLNVLAVQANSGFASPSDLQSIQAQANQLIQQINTNASSVNFNGQPLLNGQFSGTTPAAPANAQITNNDQLTGGGSVVTNVAPSAGSQAGTISVAIVNQGGGVAAAQITFTDSATGTVTNLGTVAAGSTTVVNGTSVTVGNFTPSDNATATIQVTAASAGSVNPTLNVQSGANAGSSVQVSLPNATSAGLGLQNIDFSNQYTATNAEGQIQNALTQVISAQAQIGVQTNSLQYDQTNNNTASLNLTASASAIGDSNPSGLATEIASLVTKQQISIDTINSANNTLGYLNRFFSVLK